MPYDKYGRTPDIKVSDRIGDWLCVGALLVVLAGIVTMAALVVTIIGS